MASEKQKQSNGAGPQKSSIDDFCLPEGSLDPSGVIGTKAALSRWLKAEGYCARGKGVPVDDNKVYRDARAGRLVVADARAITVGEALTYVRDSGLVRRAGPATSEEVNRLSREKLEEELLRLRLANKKARIELGAAERKYVERSLVIGELCGKYGLLEAILKKEGRSMIAKLIGRVGGDTGRADAGIELWNGAVDGALDEIGRFDSVGVVIAPNVLSVTDGMEEK